MAYLSLALKLMELLHLLAMAVTVEWPEGEAWKVMKQLQDIYWPNEVELPTPATIVSVSPTTTPMVLVMVISGFPELFVVLSPSSVGSFSFSITLNKNIDATINSCN